MAGFDSTLAGLGITRTDATTQLQDSTKKLGSRSLGQDDFLSLMTAQLKNQDPFDPVDNTQMVAQMAQFSSLAGITEMSTTLKAIADKLGAASPNDALSWVGKTVLTEGAVALPRSNGGVAGAIELDAAASRVNVSIADAAGNTVRTVELGAQAAGTTAYEWDGTTDTGDAAGPGPYTITVDAAAQDGTRVASRNLVWAPVASVTLTDGEPVLSVAGIGQIKPSAVRQVG